MQRDTSPQGVTRINRAALMIICNLQIFFVSFFKKFMFTF